MLFSCYIAQAVDRFINGDFYRYPLAAGTILDVVLELRVSWIVFEREICFNIVVGLKALRGRANFPGWFPLPWQDSSSGGTLKTV